MVSCHSRADALRELRQDIGVVRWSKGWFTVDQHLIDRFIAISAEVGWIHTDAERAKRESPLGGTVAPGNLGIALLHRITGPESAYMRYRRLYSLNQGWDKIRFLQPCVSGSRVRANSRLLGVEEKPDASLRVVVEFGIVIEGREKPWLTATKIGRFFYGSTVVSSESV